MCLWACVASEDCSGHGSTTDESNCFFINLPQFFYETWLALVKRNKFIKNIHISANLKYFWYSEMVPLSSEKIHIIFKKSKVRDYCQKIYLKHQINHTHFKRDLWHLSFGISVLFFNLIIFVKLNSNFSNVYWFEFEWDFLWAEFLRKFLICTIEKTRPEIFLIEF